METIGDGYQAICGHDNNTPDHAERMAHFAMSTVQLVPLLQHAGAAADGSNPMVEELLRLQEIASPANGRLPS